MWPLGADVARPRAFQDAALGRGEAARCATCALPAPCAASARSGGRWGGLHVAGVLTGDEHGAHKATFFRVLCFCSREPFVWFHVNIEGEYTALVDD